MARFTFVGITAFNESFLSPMQPMSEISDQPDQIEEKESMNELNSKILSLFPEIKDYSIKGDEGLTNIMMHHVAEWVRNTYNEKNKEDTTSQSIVKRITELRDWCLDQKENSDAYTVYIVGLYEAICEEKSTHSLIPLITEKEDFIVGREYLATWVGPENYETILGKWNKKV